MCPLPYPSGNFFHYDVPSKVTAICVRDVILGMSLLSCQPLVEVTVVSQHA